MRYQVRRRAPAEAVSRRCAPSSCYLRWCWLGARGQNRAVMFNRADGFQEEDTLPIPLERSPSGGASFDFCAQPGMGDGAPPVNLPNAAWLSFFAANEYAHLHYLARVFKQLGFRNGNGNGRRHAGIDWERCSTDLRMLRGFEKKHQTLLRRARSRGAKPLLEYVYAICAVIASAVVGALCPAIGSTKVATTAATIPRPHSKNT